MRLDRYRAFENKCRRCDPFGCQALAANYGPGLVLVRDHSRDRRDQAGKQSDGEVGESGPLSSSAGKLDSQIML